MYWKTTTITADLAIFSIVRLQYLTLLYFEHSLELWIGLFIDLSCSSSSSSSPFWLVIASFIENCSFYSDAPLRYTFPPPHFPPAFAFSFCSFPHSVYLPMFSLSFNHSILSRSVLDNHISLICNLIANWCDWAGCLYPTPLSAPPQTHTSIDLQKDPFHSNNQCIRAKIVFPRQ